MKKNINQQIGSGTRIFFLLFYFFVGMILASVVTVALMSIYGQKNINLLPVNVLKVVQISQELLVFVAPALLLVYMFEEYPAKYLTIRSSFSLKQLLLVVGIIVFVQPFINWLGDLNNQLVLPESLAKYEVWLKTTEDSAAKLMERFLSDTSVWGFLSAIFVIAAVAAVCEEFFFRGVLQQLFIKLTSNVHVGILITAAIFSAVHLQFYGFLPRMILGALLGYIFVWTGSIWAAVLAHFINNATVVVFHYLYVGTPLYEKYDSFGIGDTFAYTIAGFILSSVLFFFLCKTRKQKGGGDAFFITKA